MEKPPIIEEEEEGENEEEENEYIRELLKDRRLRKVPIETKVVNFFNTPELYVGVTGFERCRTVDCYKYLHSIDQGTYGSVSRAREKETGDIVVLKKLKFIDRGFVRNGFPLKFVREIHLLMSLRHENIVPVREVVVGSTMDKIYLCMDFVEHTLRELLIEMKRPFPPSEVKFYLRELLQGIAYLHENNVLHRDIKSSNILVGSNGSIRICDFGLSRIFESKKNNAYTPLVVTLWYRPLDLLLGKTKYGTELDMWSVGCIFYELLTKNVLFEGKSEIDQIIKIFGIMGKPKEDLHPECCHLVKNSRFLFKGPSDSILDTHFNQPLCPSLSPAGMDLLTRMIHMEPDQRISAEEALEHAYFFENPLPKEKSMLQTFRSTNKENIQRKKRKRDEETFVRKMYEKQFKKRKQI